MLPPVGWPGSSNPAGTMTWTRTMSWSSIAPAAPSLPPLTVELNHTRCQSLAPVITYHAEGCFEVVLLLEMMLAFPDKEAQVRLRGR
jgi:hypothetical protein